MRQTPPPAPAHASGRGPARGPDTPHRTRGALDELIRRLDAECHLGLQVRDHTWSPIREASSLADKVQGQIKRCYFSSEPALRQTLSDFKTKAGNLHQKERLELLHLLLRSQISSPYSAARGTLSQSTPREDSHKSLRGPASSHGLSQVPNSPSTFHILRNDEPASVYTTAPESPTDDEGNWSAPPSPSASIKSATKRNQASPHVSLGSRGKKRLSQSSDDDGSLPRLTKIPKGTRPPEDLPLPATRIQEVKKASLFKKPSLDMAPSYQATSTQTSFNTSFNGTTQWSSQETNTQPNTAMTSFNSDLDDVHFSSPKLTRASSTTMGSLETEDFDEVAQRLQEEQTRLSDAPTRESSSTYGSIDEDVILQISSSHEANIGHSVASRPVRDMGPTPSRAVGFFAPKARQETPEIIASHESPSGMSHRIRNIPQQNIFLPNITEGLKNFPYFILFICLRIGTGRNITLQELMADMDEALARSDPEYFWAQICSHPKVGASLGSHEPKRVWQAVEDKFDGYTFKGIVTLNTKSAKQVLGVELLPLQKEDSCRFQRAFGADRFLYLNFPSFDSGSKSTGYNQTEMNQIRIKWKEWLHIEHSFLGRKWRAFHVKPVKKGKGSGPRSTDELYGTRVVLFATEGIGIDKPCSIWDMLDWFFPFGKNLHESLCKAYARLDLGLSTTTPTFVFKPSQVRYVKDREADDTPEDASFNDPNLHWEDIEDKPVMNDGCSLVSLEAAKEIWRIYKKKTGMNERMPCAFQARIGGAKGLWVVSCGSEKDAPPPMGINISRSQLKFDPHPADLKDDQYDPHRLTFELLDYSTSPSPSDLHLSFISIMVDRGVPRSTIEKIMVDRLDQEREQLLEMLVDPMRMYDWLHKQRASTQDMDEVLWQAALPSVLGDRIKLLLESGFHPTEEPYLANCLCRLIKQEQLWEEQKLRVDLGKSTFLFGVPDPLGVLAPGEIHVQFSTWFTDENTEERYLCLDDVDVLVARQPACRRSDLQKVRAISHPKLGHLLDVIVFPVKGQYPLAGKLQGGDYDGDIFWLCWETELVETFKNAPAPVQALDPSKYGINTFSKKLHDVVNRHGLPSLDIFLKEAMEFRIAPSLLGKVTNYLEKQAYAENRVFSQTLDALCDMHDLLVDAPKQGYTFTDKEFSSAKKKLQLPRNPVNPAYKAAMEACANAKEMGEADRIRSKDWQFREDSVIDYLYFRVVREHNVETLRMVEEVLSKKINDDTNLRYPYLHERGKRNLTIEYELKRLVKSLDNIVGEWNSGMMKDGGNTDADQYNSTVDKCFKMFRALKPERIDTQEIKPWVEPYLSVGFTIWEALRASALYTEYPRKAAFVFHMAGKELADLKCPPSRTVRRVCAPIFSILRPRITKVLELHEEVDSEDEEFMTPMEEIL